MRTLYRRSPAHYALGTSMDSACGIYGLWDRGLNYTRQPADVTCGHCRRWLAKNLATPVAR